MKKVLCILIGVFILFVACNESNLKVAESDDGSVMSQNQKENQEMLAKFFTFNYQGNEQIERLYQYSINPAKITLPAEDIEEFLAPGVDIYNVKNKYSYEEMINNLSESYYIQPLYEQDKENWDLFFTITPDNYDYAIFEDDYTSTSKYLKDGELRDGDEIMYKLVVLKPVDGYVTIYVFATFVSI